MRHIRALTLGLRVRRAIPLALLPAIALLGGAASSAQATPCTSSCGPAVTVTQSPQTAEAGRPVKFTAAASGGLNFFGDPPMSYLYGFATYEGAYTKADPPSGSPIKDQAESSSNEYEETFASPGQYTVQVIVQNEDGNSGEEEAFYTITVGPALTNAKIEATQNSNAPTGDVVAGSLETLSASAEDGVGPYTYSWTPASSNSILEPNTSQTITELFGDEKEGYGVKVFNPENEKYGIHNTPTPETTEVTVTDADGASVKAPNTTGKILATLMKTSIAPPSSTIYATVESTFSATTTGGVSPYTYEWSIAKGPGPAPASSFTPVGSGQSVSFAFPASETEQHYIVSVTARDSAQPYAQALEEGIEVTVQPTPKISEETKVAASCPNSSEQREVTFKLPAITHAAGCFTVGKSSAGATTYTTSGTIHLNDLPITPNAATGPLVLTAPTASDPGGSISVPDAAAAFNLPNGKVLQLVQGKLQFALPALAAGASSGQAKVVSLGSASGVSLFGFKIGGSVTLNFDLNSKGEYTSSVDLLLDLPSIFKSGPPDGSDPPGGVSGEVQIEIGASGPVFDGLHFEIENAYIGSLTVNELCLTVIPGGSGFTSACAPKNAAFTAPSNQVLAGCGTTNLNPSIDTWTASASISLPKPLTATIGVFGGGETASNGSTTIDYLGGQGTNLGIPLFEGVDLESLGAGVCFNPLKITGELGIGLLPIDGNDAVVLSGALTYEAGEPYAPATKTTAAVPAKPWNLNLKGEVEVFKKEIGNGEIDVDQDGDFNFGVNLQFGLGSYVTLSGGVSGWVEPQYKLFDVNGHIMVAIDIGGIKASAQAEGAVSSAGAAGCIGVTFAGETISVGAGALWNQAPNLMFGSCSVGAYEVAQAASAAGAGGSKQLKIPAGLHGIAVRVAGTTGPPRVLITGPGGRRIESPASAPLQLVKGKYLLMEDPEHKATDVLIVAPKAGRYTITSLTPGDSIVSLGTGRVLPSFVGHGTVSGHGAKRKLRVTYTLPPGAKLSLVERGSHVVHTIARDVHGKVCPGAKKRSDGRRMLCFTTSFTPTRGAGGVRKIEANVERGGLPQPSIVVARYRAPALGLPTKPAKVQLRRSAQTITIRWSPSAGAAQYSVLATTSLGRQSLFTLNQKCRAVKLTGIPKNVGLTARVEGVRYDAVGGPARAVALGSGAAKSGAKGKQLRGAICSR